MGVSLRGGRASLIELPLGGCVIGQFREMLGDVFPDCSRGAGGRSSDRCGADRATLRDRDAFPKERLGFSPEGRESGAGGFAALSGFGIDSCHQRRHGGLEGWDRPGRRRAWEARIARRRPQCPGGGSHLPETGEPDLRLLDLRARFHFPKALIGRS